MVYVTYHKPSLNQIYHNLTAANQETIWWHNTLDHLNTRQVHYPDPTSFVCVRREGKGEGEGLNKYNFLVEYFLRQYKDSEAKIAKKYLNSSAKRVKF